MLLACTKTQDTFVNNCCTTNLPNGAVAYAIGASVGPNDVYMQWAGIWRKQVKVVYCWRKEIKSSDQRAASRQGRQARQDAVNRGGRD